MYSPINDIKEFAYPAKSLSFKIFTTLFFFTSFLCARIKLAIKEAEIQKLQANLTANQLSQSLISRNDKESGKLNSLETEPVKLGGSQLGEYILEFLK